MNRNRFYNYWFKFMNELEQFDSQKNNCLLYILSLMDAIIEIKQNTNKQ